jgi:hypothetical protein
MRLAAPQVQFACDWRPPGYNLYATGGQLHTFFACDWRSLGNNLSICLRLATRHIHLANCVLNFSSNTERLHGQSVIAQTLCLALFRHASKPVRLNSYFSLSPGSLEKRLDLQLKVFLTEVRPTLLNSKHIFLP